MNKRLRQFHRCSSFKVSFFIRVMTLQSYKRVTELLQVKKLIFTGGCQKALCLFSRSFIYRSYKIGPKTCWKESSNKKMPKNDIGPIMLFLDKYWAWTCRTYFQKNTHLKWQSSAFLITDRYWHKTNNIRVDWGMKDQENKHGLFKHPPFYKPNNRFSTSEKTFLQVKTWFWQAKNPFLQGKTAFLQVIFSQKFFEIVENVVTLKSFCFFLRSETPPILGLNLEQIQEKMKKVQIRISWSRAPKRLFEMASMPFPCNGPLLCCSNFL